MDASDLCCQGTLTFNSTSDFGWGRALFPQSGPVAKRIEPSGLMETQLHRIGVFDREGEGRTGEDRGGEGRLCTHLCIDFFPLFFCIISSETSQFLKRWSSHEEIKHHSPGAE